MSDNITVQAITKRTPPLAKEADKVTRKAVASITLKVTLYDDKTAGAELNAKSHERKGDYRTHQAALVEVLQAYAGKLK